jgi:pyridoxamine 5'-phosphate oxidase
MAWFARWYAVAQTLDLHEPTAMTLATVDADGTPSCRVVLLKDFDARGFVFYTNLQSRKGQALAHHQRAALLFWWPPQERQVRVEGRVSLVDDAEADAYYASRPRGSQLGAWASPQSRPIASRATLQEGVSTFAARFADQAVPRPPHWSGWRVEPLAMEFWQGRPDRLHDRVRLERQADGWRAQRLAP